MARASHRHMRLSRRIMQLRRHSYLRRRLDNPAIAWHLIADDGAILEASDRACRDLGYTRRELKRMHASQIEMNLPRHINSEAMSKLFAGKPSSQPLVRHGTHRRKDGSTYSVQIQLFSVEVDARPAVVALTKPLKVEKGDRQLSSVYRKLVRREREHVAEVLQNEHRYRQLIENLNVGLFRTTGGRGSGKYLEANQELARMLGYDSPRELMRRNVDETYADPAQRREVWNEIRCSGSLRNKEVLCRRKDGSLLWVAISARPQCDAAGRVRWLDGIMVDISQRKQIEEDLSRSEQLYRMVVESAGESICLADTAGNYVFMNKIGCERLGWPEGGYVGKSIRSAFPRRYAEHHMNVIRAVVDGGQPMESEIWTMVGGSLRFYRTTVRPIRDQAGKISSVLIIARDATENKRIYDELQTSETRYRDLFENSPETIFELDTSRYPPVIVAANRKASEVYGYLQDEFAGMSVAKLVPPEAMEMLRFSVQQSRAGETVTFESYNVRRSGEVFPIRLTGAIFSHAQQRAIVNIEDISQERQTEMALEAARHKITVATDQERHRLAGELHDSIGQAFFAMQLAIESVLKDSRDDLSKDAAGRLGKAARRCNEMISEVRRISHGLFPPTLESLGLAAALRQLGRDMGPTVHVSVRCRKLFETIRPEQQAEIVLYRVAQEAVTNAVRHSGASRIQLTLSCTRDRARLKIADNGKGFDVQKAMATGIGLGSMRERANVIGGRLTIQSRPGCTEITLEAPLARTLKAAKTAPHRGADQR